MGDVAAAPATSKWMGCEGSDWPLSDPGESALTASGNSGAAVVRGKVPGVNAIPDETTAQAPTTASSTPAGRGHVKAWRTRSPTLPDPLREEWLLGMRA
ncbi:hypothetical protein [Arthrobacter cryoconiti]|uniref:Uncharacterized protein n=1 Tax=Arthrobacter cryoconiti TaxID=748907 RepID=A0ABV8QZ92_9MICC|nr:hypothetical protein [Arthrobacter cryoconiti]